MKIKNMKMVTVLTTVLLLFLLQFNLNAFENYIGSNEATVEDIRKAISITMRPVFYGRLIARDKEEQKKYARVVVSASKKYRIDPYLFTAMGFYESSFRPNAIGTSRGEIGVWQVHGVATKGCNLKTLEGQADCSASWLREQIDFCGDVEAGLTSYICGSCTSNKDKTLKAVRRRLKLAQVLKRKVYEKKLISLR